MAIQHLAACAPAAPGPGESAMLPARDTPLHRLPWGGAFSRERPRNVGFHAQDIYTKANRLVFRSPKVSVWEMLSWYHHATKAKEQLQNCAHLCQELLASGVWVRLPGPCVCLLKPPCACQPRGWHSSHTAAREGGISRVNSCFPPSLQV